MCLSYADGLKDDGFSVTLEILILCRTDLHIRVRKRHDDVGV